MNNMNTIYRSGQVTLMSHIHVYSVERRYVLNRSNIQNYHTPGFDSLNDLIPTRRGPGKGLFATLRRHFASDSGSDVPNKH